MRPNSASFAHWYGCASIGTSEFFVIQFAVVVQKPQSPSKIRMFVILGGLVLARNGNNASVKAVLDFNLADFDLKFANGFTKCAL